jgi:hypothetical protein
MQSKIGILMSMPDGKLPGFYAQIVKALANKATLFDRDKEMLIVSTEEERQDVLEIMKHYKIDTEVMELLLLPDNAESTNLFSDYGFRSRSENIYLYKHVVSVFRFEEESPESGKQAALQQMEEHLIARFTENGNLLFAVDKQLEELMHGIAKAYRCRIAFLPDHGC